MINHSISQKKLLFFNIFSQKIHSSYFRINFSKKKENIKHTQVAQKVSNTQNKEEILLKTLVSTVKK